MNKIDNETDAVEETAESASPEDQHHEKESWAGFAIVFFLVGLIGSLLVGWIVYPKLLYSQKKQPFDFNHRLHMDLVDDGCESCHFFRDDGTYAGVPKLAQCIDCHEDVQGDTEDERIFVEEYVSHYREVPWLIYSRQPDCVFFSHVAHVKNAEIKCEVCHGHIGDSESLKVYEENRITGYSRDIWGKNIAGIKKNSWDRMKMDDCADCHKKSGVQPTSVQTERDACFVCHK
jgi:hypothetical protein